MSSNNVVRPFKIAVSDAKLQNLKSKLSCTTFPDELDFTDDWKYGVPLKEVKRLTAYWQHGYDWRENEARLNQETSQYMIDIDVDGFGDVGIHFVHHRSEKAAAIPLLFVHGCKCPLGHPLPLVSQSPQTAPRLTSDGQGPEAFGRL